MSVTFAAISPHPPLILPSVGRKEDRKKVKKTIESLEYLGKRFKQADPHLIIISSPHPDWGFNVPLHFLAPQFEGEIKTFLTGTDSPRSCFEKGKKVFKSISKEPDPSKVALIASGDLSHRLKEEGPYGFHPDGPKFDKDLIKSLREKDIPHILKLDEKYPQAGECGLRSFCFLLGFLQATSINWKPQILSYEGPFGVGYLVANFKLFS